MNTPNCIWRLGSTTWCEWIHFSRTNSTLSSSSSRLHPSPSSLSRPPFANTPLLACSSPRFTPLLYQMRNRGQREGGQEEEDERIRLGLSCWCGFIWNMQLSQVLGAIWFIHTLCYLPLLKKWTIKNGTERWRCVLANNIQQLCVYEQNSPTIIIRVLLNKLSIYIYYSFFYLPCIDMYDNLCEPWIKTFTEISITTATWKS